MKKINLLIVIFCCGLSTFAQQSYPGYRSGNYTGVNSVFFNPSNIAGSRYRWAVNLFSVNTGVGNNTASFKLKDFTTTQQNDFQNKFFGGSGQTNAGLNIDVLGPSFMFNLNSKSSMAVTSRIRAIGNIKEIEGNLLESISDSGNFALPFTFSNGANSRVITNGWAEIGLAYAREIYNKGANYFKGGITLKYLSGATNNYVQANNVRGTINEDASSNPYLENASGTINVGQAGIKSTNSDSLSIGDFFKKGQNGIGADIGFVYEYRPDYATDNNIRGGLNRYKFKLGLALLDFGKIKYTANPENSGGYTADISGSEKFYLKEISNAGLANFKTVLENHPNFFTRTPEAGSPEYKVSLPTTLQIDFDYHLHRGFYINTGGQLNMINKNSIYDANQYNSITITPRYEGKTFGLYIPVNYNELTQFNAGLSLRAGPLFLGSGSIITALAKSKQADFHIGFNFGFVHKGKENITPAPVVVPVVVDKMPNPTQDSDGDGVIDTKDKCPSVAGLVSNEGCPPSAPVDSDGDGIFDNEDKCINVRGVSRYLGCPVPDSDGDGINDEEDKCVNIRGEAKYQGCPIPDTDSDGVNDAEDKCPLTAGTPANFGCPEIKEEIIKKVQFAASNLNFVSGTAAILPKSFAALNTLTNILKTDESLKLSLEGHTDNVGTEEKNQMLSEARANAVKAYFVKKGIDKDRIATAGFGASKPIADNKTAAGKAINRRVEFKVSNY